MLYSLEFDLPSLGTKLAIKIATLNPHSNLPFGSVINSTLSLVYSDCFGIVSSLITIWSLYNCHFHRIYIHEYFIWVKPTF